MLSWLGGPADQPGSPLLRDQIIALAHGSIGVKHASQSKYQVYAKFRGGGLRGGVSLYLQLFHSHPPGVLGTFCEKLICFAPSR